MDTTEEKQTEAPPQTLYTVAKFSQRHSFITEGGLRFQIFNAKENGLAESGAIIRIGRRVLIDEKRYLDWIESLQENKEAGKC